MMGSSICVSRVCVVSSIGDSLEIDQEHELECK
jgi:hypothetical protein